MKQTYILAIDAGTTSSRAILFNRDCQIVGLSQKEFTQFFPKPGWVEHDALEIWDTQLFAIRELLRKTGVLPSMIAGIGITNQRETTVVWNRHTGIPIHRAIVWQCRRTADYCETLKGTAIETHIKERTGLVADAYFSGTKVKWLLDHVQSAREEAEKGDLLFGTIDCWLLWKLTGGKVHATDFSNASRTMLFDIIDLKWDPTLLNTLGVPSSMLPEVRPSSGFFGNTCTEIFGELEIPVTGMAGDQQAALFGQTCFQPGTAKNTYGTGCFLVMNTGKKRVTSQNGLLTTIAWKTGAEPVYALEGSVFSAGAAIQWLRDGLQLIKTAAESESCAMAIESSEGVYMVPAFTGLGAPHWDMFARGAILGLTRGSTRNHIIRATLESIAYQSLDLFGAMKKDSGIELAELRVDGGASANQFLMQFQADLLQTTVSRPAVLETTAMGAAFLAGLATGFWPDMKAIERIRVMDMKFKPEMTPEKVAVLHNGWKKAVQRAGAWET